MGLKLRHAIATCGVSLVYIVVFICINMCPFPRLRKFLTDELRVVCNLVLISMGCMIVMAIGFWKLRGKQRDSVYSAEMSAQEVPRNEV